MNRLTASYIYEHIDIKDALGVTPLDFTRTIPSDASLAEVEQWFDGTYEVGIFPLWGVPQKAMPGDWMYLIYQGRIYGRCRIIDIKRREELSAEENEYDDTCLVYIKCPGERSPREILRKGHQGIRYCSDVDWA